MLTYSVNMEHIKNAMFLENTKLSNKYITYFKSAV